MGIFYFKKSFGGKNMQMTGAKILMECLLEQGVDTIFGYPGGTILNVYDELYKYNGKIKHILTSHEQGAAQTPDAQAMTEADNHG